MLPLSLKVHCVGYHAISETVSVTLPTLARYSLSGVRARSVTLNELSDRRLAWQPDIYQRYSFLARLTDILSGEGSGALTLLDVGSGPIALTEAFVSPRFDIVRADVGQFDDPSIVRLQPGEPLPFEDAAFDVAVAIEVLEHVPPAQRPSLIRELQRVSRQATIVCCPD